MNENREQDRIRELIDACRPGQDDLAQPEFQLLAARINTDRRLKEQLERSQQLDSAIASTFQDVEIPAGLADRLLDALAVQGGGQPLVGDGDDPVVRRSTRRHCFTPARLAICGGIVAAAAMVVLVFAQFASRDSITTKQLADDALRWTDSAEMAPNGWLDLKGRVSRRYPFNLPRNAQLGPPLKWQTVGKSVAACYDLQARDGGGPAYLIVVPNKKVTGFPVRPRLVHKTGGRCVAVWTANGHLYALVFEGKARRFDQLIPAMPTA